MQKYLENACILNKNTLTLHRFNKDSLNKQRIKV